MRFNGLKQQQWYQCLARDSQCITVHFVEETQITITSLQHLQPQWLLFLLFLRWALYLNRVVLGDDQNIDLVFIFQHQGCATHATLPVVRMSCNRSGYFVMNLF